MKGGLILIKIIKIKQIRKRVENIWFSLNTCQNEKPTE